MKKKKFLGVALSAALAISSLAACSSGDSTSGDEANGDSKKITFWTPFSGADGPRMKNIVKDYNESQDKLKDLDEDCEDYSKEDYKDCD